MNGLWLDSDPLAALVFMGGSFLVAIWAVGRWFGD